MEEKSLPWDISKKHTLNATGFNYSPDLEYRTSKEVLLVLLVINVRMLLRNAA